MEPAADVVVDVYFEVRVQRQEKRSPRQAGVGLAGYGTNQLEMGLAAVVWGYRGQYRIEDDWSRLKGRSLGLTPLYCKRRGGSRVGAAVERGLAGADVVGWVVRERLRRDGKHTPGGVCGAGRTETSRPSCGVCC